MENRSIIKLLHKWIIGIIFIGIGIAPLIYILSICWEDFSIENNGTKVEAEVIEKLIDPYSKEITYVLKYKDVVYEKEYTYSFKAKRDAGDKGDFAEIRYKPDDPSNVYIGLEKNNKLILLITFSVFAAITTYVGYKFITV